MFKSLAKRLSKSALLAATAMILTPLWAGATTYVNEDFDYNAGNLYQQGGWLRNSNKSVAPIQLIDQSLTYDGYKSAKTGLAAKLAGAGDANDERLVKKVYLDDSGKGLLTTTYASFLVNVAKGGGIDTAEQMYFFGFTPTNYLGFVDEASNSIYGRVFAIGSENAGKFKLGIAKGNTYADATTEDLNLGETYLVVVKYEFVDGTSNDIFSMWVNPVKGPETATDLVSSTKTDISSTKGIIGVNLYQGGSSVRLAPELTVDAIRVADSWDELFVDNGGGQGDTPTTPSISLGKSELQFATYAYMSTKATVNIKAENLTEDITVSGLAAPFSTETTTIAKEDAMAPAGYNLEIVYDPTAAGEATATVTLTGSGLTKTVSLKGSAYDAIQIARSSQIINQPADGEEVFVYTGKATVTFVDKKKNRIYAQDVFGALCIDCSYIGDVTVEPGDVITKIAGGITKELNAPYLLAYMPSITVTSKGSQKEPLELSIAELLASPETYIHRLVRVNDVTFTPTEGQKFTTAAVKGKAGSADVTVMAFDGTDVIGTAVPEAASVIGISRSMSIASIGPRSVSDIIAASTGVPSMEITPETVFTGEAAPINADTEVARFTVNAANLTSPVTIWLGGAGAGMFSTSVETIPAGTSETVVSLIYHPTAIGKHTVRINFETTPSELNYGKQYTAIAYDPENLPTITVDESALTAFSAKVGETQEQTVTVTTANFPDYGSIKVMGEGNGAFIIGSTMLMKNMSSQLKITFAPKAEGEFTERIMFSGILAEPVYVTVKGSTTGGIGQEEKQGDELPLVADAPLTLLTESFDNVTRNKPFAIDGWKNLALEGTRAWWGYTWDEPEANSAAKITAYDSNVAPGEGSPCQMMLVTPALDFKNAQSRMLTFRIMGDNLTEEMTDNLEVCYIALDNGEMYIEPIKGLGIPATSDYNGEWRDYVLDLSDNELDDVFFIGFRFTSTRGRDNSAIYYVDDVTYGRTDIPFIKPATLTDEFIATANEDNKRTYTVTGSNLTGPITLATGGANSSKFSVEPATLPAEGGEFTVTFNSDLIGIHEGEIIFTADGAPASAMLLTVHNREGLTARFSAQECASVIYANGFDSADDFAEWTLNQTNSRSTWQLGTQIQGAPEFSSIDPESTSSLVINYSGSAQNESLTSPAMTIPEGAACSFYSAFSGVWQYYGSYSLMVNLPDGSSDKLFNSFDWSQENAHENPRWIKFSFDLAKYAGKEVSFSFVYQGRSGEDIIIDNFEVSAVSDSDDAKASIAEDGEVHFLDLSTGAPVAWSWSMPGATVETSTEQNPVAVYPAAGTYDVTLTVTDAAGKTSTVERKGFVTVTMESPIAVIGLPEGGYLAPYGSIFVPTNTEVTFTDKSKGKNTTRKWSFTGADITSSTDETVTVKYAVAGTYSVDLEVTNAAGTSTTYHEGILAGGENHIWNIEVEENTALAPINLSWYGYYGGSNFLGMTAFGEKFEKPLVNGTVSSVDIFFAKNQALDPESPVKVAIARSENGLPGATVAEASLPAKDIQAEDGQYIPTTFNFPTRVTIDDEFFVVVEIPSNASETSYDTDEIAMYCSPRRPDGGKSTVYHLLAEEDDNYQPTGEYNWYKNVDENLSFAIAPKFAYNEMSTGVESAISDDSTVSVTVVGSELAVRAADAIGSLTVYNIAGAAVIAAAPASTEATVSIASLPAGVYVVAVNTASTTVSKKIVIR